MKSSSVGMIAILLLLGCSLPFLTGCPGKNNPSAPNPAPTATFTDTPCEINGTPCTPTFTATPTLTATDTFTPTSTFTPTVTSTPVDTPVVCNVQQSLGYGTGAILEANNEVELSPVTLTQDSNIGAIQLNQAGFTFQALIYGDTGSHYPNQMIYFSQAIMPMSTPVTITVSPQMSLPAGVYWVGMAVEGTLTFVSTDTSIPINIYCAFQQIPGNLFPQPVTLSAYSTFPSQSNTAYTVTTAMDGLSVMLLTCHP